MGGALWRAIIINRMIFCPLTDIATDLPNVSSAVNGFNYPSESSTGLRAERRERPPNKARLVSNAVWPVICRRRILILFECQMGGIYRGETQVESTKLSITFIQLCIPASHCTVLRDKPRTSGARLYELFTTFLLSDSTCVCTVSF